MFALTEDECMSIIYCMSSILAGRTWRNPWLIVRVRTLTNHPSVLPIVAGTEASARRAGRVRWQRCSRVPSFGGQPWGCWFHLGQVDGVGIDMIAEKFAKCLAMFFIGKAFIKVMVLHRKVRRLVGDLQHGHICATIIPVVLNYLGGATSRRE